jgi:prolycopene isomerase
MMDGGYYFDEGVQVLPDILISKFKELGGDIMLATSVKKIKVKDGKVEGVVLRQDGTLSAKYVISNVDAVQTFSQLLGEEVVGPRFLNRLSELKPSLSMFILHLGLRDSPKGLPKKGANIWFMPHYDIEGMYKAAKNRNANNLAEYMVHVFSEKTMSVFINAGFKDVKYWRDQRERISDSLIRMIQRAMPILSDNIIYKQPTTPQALRSSTLNHEGAAYGWASMPSQFAEPGLSQITSIKNLYTAGHWTTLAQGIGGVAYLGRDTANIILKKEASE